MSKRRDQLLEMAEHVFATKGYAETTMADLAEAAGVTRPTVYAYFSSKDDVLAAVAAGVRASFLELQDQVAGEGPEEVLGLTLRAYLHQWVLHYGVLTVIEHQALGDPAYAALLTDIHQRTNRRHEKYLRRLVDEGLVSPAVEPGKLTEFVTGVSMRFAQLISVDPQSEERYGDALVEAHLALLGLRTAGARPSASAVAPRAPKGAGLD